jgi:acyl dehydratase
VGSERELRFSDEDMILFAAGSGDSSPLHTDPAFARRTPYGACIVYGGLLSIALLGTLPADVLLEVRSVRSSFPEPVLPGERSLALAARHPSRDGVWEVRLSGRGKLLARMVADSGREASRADETLARAAASPGSADSSAGRAVGVGDATTGTYRPGHELVTLGRRFGAETLHPALLDGIGWASYAVGMGMPGFQGLCAAVAVTTANDEVSRDEPCARAWLLVRDHDERTERRLVDGVLSDSSGTPRTVAQVECLPIAAPAT